jgi:ribosome-associated toxin RatA of RatAB toxin-antitoxin module
MAEHHASVTVNAPVDQVYDMFTHFNDFPKFMSFVKEVTYYDDQRSHWVAEVVGQHEWDAVNENWVEDRQIGWRSYNGLENSGKVTFQPVGANQTKVDVYINYNPPAGVLGDVGENLGVGARFDNVLQHDLDNFARMVDQAPPGALDPTSSNYLFHGDSAAAKGTTTERQNQTMGENTPGSGSTAATGSDYVSEPGSSSTPGTSSDYTTGTSGAYTTGGYPTDRPVTDQDIISGQYDRGEGYADPTRPSGTGTANPVMPPESGTANPLMPPERDSDTTY